MLFIQPAFTLALLTNLFFTQQPFSITGIAHSLKWLPEYLNHFLQRVFFRGSGIVGWFFGKEFRFCLTHELLTIYLFKLIFFNYTLAHDYNVGALQNLSTILK